MSFVKFWSFFWIGFVLLTGSASWVFAAGECAPFLDQCEYYKCREERQPCGEDGYVNRFAYPYCKQFMEDVKPILSEDGQEWLDQVGFCLRNELEPVPFDLSCKDTEDHAIETHFGCYVGTGFCHIPFGDKFQIFQTVMKELRDSRMRKVMRKIAWKCSFGLFF